MYTVEMFRIMDGKVVALARFLSLEGAMEYTMTVTATVEIRRKGKLIGRFFKGQCV